MFAINIFSFTTTTMALLLESFLNQRQNLDAPNIVRSQQTTEAIGLVNLWQLWIKRQRALTSGRCQLITMHKVVTTALAEFVRCKQKLEKEHKTYIYVKHKEF